MNKKLQNENVSRFFESVLGLENIEDCSNFFEDICTVAELQEMSQRLYVAALLDEGKTYQEIIRLTGASTATISRINKCLEYGANGYVAALKRMKEKHEN